MEDEPDVADIIRRAVRSAAWSPTAVGTGRDALLALAGDEFDLVVLDVGLPDLDGFEVCRRVRARGGHTPILHLTAREYALLEYLMRNPRRVVSRTQILEHVWDDNFDPLGNAVDVLVSRVRRKVDGGRAHALVHTIRGVGYVLTDRNAPRAA